MPLTPFQSGVLQVIRANRSEASHFAGGLVLNGPEQGMHWGQGPFARNLCAFSAHL